MQALQLHLVSHQAALHLIVPLLLDNRHLSLLAHPHLSRVPHSRLGLSPRLRLVARISVWDSLTPWEDLPTMGVQDLGNRKHHPYLSAHLYQQLQPPRPVDPSLPLAQLLLLLLVADRYENSPPGEVESDEHWLS